MTSESQRRANRLNSAKSTGPRTGAGKAKVAQNGRRHGLNTPLQSDQLWNGRAHHVAKEIAGDQPVTPEILAYAIGYVDLERINAAKEGVRKRWLPPLNGSPLSIEDLNSLTEAWRELRKIDGYERKALSRLRKAQTVLDSQSSGGPNAL